MSKAKQPIVNPTPNSPPSVAVLSPSVPDLDRAIVAFHFAYLAVIAEADELLHTHGFGRAHHKILYFVARNDLPTTSALREFLGVTRQALQRPVNELHKAALLETTVGVSDRRLHVLRLTDAGRKLERQATAPIRSVFSRAFGQVSPVEADAWLKVTMLLKAG